MNVTLVRVPGASKVDRPDDHFELPEPHPLEGVIRERGLCAQAKDNTPWLDVRREHHRNINREAKTLCLTKCPVQAECRQVVDHIEGPAARANRGSLGLGPNRITGIWAGEFPRERVLRRRRASKEREGA